MTLNPKKIIGSLGRKYGGNTFQKIRKAYYISIDFFKQINELVYLSRGKYAPSHSDRQFFEKNYSDPHEKKAPLQKTGYICLCDGKMYHGGPTDRLRGILTSYREAKKKNIPFYISWTHPFPLDKFLIPADFDWRISPSELSYYKDEAWPFIIEDEPDFHGFLRMKIGLKPRRPQIHIYSNADNARGEYRQLFNELFKPSPVLLDETQRHLKILGNDYQAFTFRFLQLLGDFKDWGPEALHEEERGLLIDKVSREFLKLTENIADSQRILVTSDSRRFLDHISSIDKRVYVVAGDVKNIDLLDGEFDDAWMKTFIDQQLLMHASKVTLMRTGKMYKSGFPRFAAEVGGAKFVDYSF